MLQILRLFSTLFLDQTQLPTLFFTGSNLFDEFVNL
jgi:hypothetical protein